MKGGKIPGQQWPSIFVFLVLLVFFGK